MLQCSWYLLLRQTPKQIQNGTLQVKFFIHFNYSLHKVKGRLISSVHYKKKLIRNGILVWKNRGLSLQRADQKIYITAKSHLQSSAGKEEGTKGAGNWERNKGPYLIKSFYREVFLIKLVPLYQSSRFKRFPPMWGFSRPLNTHKSADRGSRRKAFQAAKLKGQTMGATSR